MRQPLALLAYSALLAAEWLRGIGLVAAGALSYGLLGGHLPLPGGYDYLVGLASFATIAVGALDLTLTGLNALRVSRARATGAAEGGPIRAHVIGSALLSLALIALGNPLLPQVALVLLATVTAIALRLDTPTSTKVG
jgi:hypothetical protein